MCYTLKTTNVYRVPTVEDALRLRKHLEKTCIGELVASLTRLSTLRLKAKSQKNIKWLLPPSLLIMKKIQKVQQLQIWGQIFNG